MTMQKKDIEHYLERHGIKPSYHRMRIFTYLEEKKNHPSADQIFQDLHKEIPTLSKTTVYNTLNLFLEKGVAIQILSDENETRYDADTSMHGHFQCSNCRQIFDIKMDETEFRFEELAGYQVFESHFYFKGLCPFCQGSPDKGMKIN
jgi:Fe2+ or Zn2+ uptake regulation protein